MIIQMYNEETFHTSEVTAIASATTQNGIKSCETKIFLSYIQCGNFLSLYNYNRSYSKDSYLKVKVLYNFGSFFGRSRIFLRESFSEYQEGRDKKGIQKEVEERARGGKSFDSLFYSTMYCISEDFFFSKIKEEEISSSEIESASIPKYVVDIIGDLMTKEAKVDEKTTSEVISLTEFIQKYENSAEYKKVVLLPRQIAV